ncbi:MULTISPECIES: hypothetical protein [unclassified Caballeronia]|uniref:hypothetical protein n=1 Tax=unclassified Caballeronia TaxID=2646786 RepID=UPI0028620355|nr:MULTISPECIES: hypothetical protein [unclassified Caballeronia]MDR5821784.1 hypothetical protein [Caballeronia sp. LZ043]MDR5880728.1 hypothetical protein [Caballeronia sp. LZ032]
MSLPPIAPDLFIKQINELLPDKQGYTPDLVVFLTPRGCQEPKATGWDWQPHSPETDAAVKQAFEDIRHLHGF